MIKFVKFFFIKYYKKIALSKKNCEYKYRDKKQEATNEKQLYTISEPKT